jgi:sporulation protein YlmC with PRC-barrel domain
MRKILMSSVASMALLGVAAGFGGPLLAQTDAPAATAQDQNAQNGDTQEQGNVPASSQGDATQSAETQGGDAIGAAGATGADQPLASAPPEEMRYRSIQDAEAGSITLPNEMTTEEIVGANVYDANDESIGEVVDLLVTEDGQVSQVLVDVGGFLGMGEHRVALDLDEIEFVDADGVLRASVDVTEEELEAMPAFERAEDNYWVGSAGPVGSPVMPDTTAEQTRTAATEAPALDDTEYRSWDQAGEADMMMGDMSAKDVLGATVYGLDGDGIGEVADLLIDPDNNIDRLIVDVGGFLGMGVHTVALPADEMQIAAVDGEQRITVSATKEELEAMPSYERDADGKWLVNE